MAREDRNINRLSNLLALLLKNPKTTHGMRRAIRNLGRELKLTASHKKGIKQWEKSDKKHVFEKIQIGGGRHTKVGYFNIDIVTPADLVCDVREGIPLPDHCSSLIFNEHFLEHVDYPVSAKKIVQECHRILKPGGKLVVGVPDAELAIKKYITKDKEYYERMLATWYGGRGSMAHFNTYVDLLNYIFRDEDDDDVFTPHLWAYDLEKLTSLLREAGFNNVRKWKFDPEIARNKRRWASVYVEGER